MPTALMFFCVLAVGIIQIWLGFLGIEYLSNTIWAFLAVLALFFLRIILPLTIGTYFGAVEVMGWEPIIGLILAVPGFFFILPSILMSAIEPFLSKNNKSNSEIYSNYTEPKNMPQIIEHEPQTKVEQNTSIKSPPVLTKTSEEQNKVKGQQKEIKPSLVKSEDEVLAPFPDARIVIEYDENASKLWNELKGLDKEIGFEFIECLQKDPKQDVKKLHDDLKGKFEKQKFQQEHPYADPNANKAFQEALQISEAAKDEFSKVYELMKDKLEPDQILKKVKVKFSKQQVELANVEANLQIFLFKNWEEELRNAERSGDIDKILRVFAKLGYKTDAEYKKIIRPKLGDSAELQQEHIPFNSVQDLMRVVGEERRLLLKVK
ncbi:hypothetical protein OAZ20_05565 [Paracoccaceae bacterium]|nr:hypothetical protein [Paracoccaceae bacterium]